MRKQQEEEEFKRALEERTLGHLPELRKKLSKDEPSGIEEEEEEKEELINK